MLKRTTIELDDQLLARARRALGASTIRATVEDALRRVADAADADGQGRAELQQRYLLRLADRVDSDVLASEEMWR